MPHQTFGWTHQVELVDGVTVNTSRTLFPYSDTKTVAATSAFIVAASLALFHLRKHAPTPLQPRRKTPSALMHLFLTLDFAIEYPLLLAFHPCTLAYPRDPFGRAELPTSLAALAGQVCVCCAVDAACSLALARWSRSACAAGKFLPDQAADPALRCTVLFLRPRAAVLVAAALLGTPASCITRVTGRLHGVSMAVWILVQQHFGAVGDQVALLEEE